MTENDYWAQVGEISDRVENIAFALKLPLSNDFHLRQMKMVLPEIVADLRKLVVEATGENYWA